VPQVRVARPFHDGGLALEPLVAQRLVALKLVALPLDGEHRHELLLLLLLLARPPKLLVHRRELLSSSDVCLPRLALRTLEGTARSGGVDLRLRYSRMSAPVTAVSTARYDTVRHSTTRTLSCSRRRQVLPAVL
jgi:hypothetical protein